MLPAGVASIANKQSFPSEEPFIGRLDRDPQAFLALYDLYFSRVRNYVHYRVQDPQDAEDLTAAVFEQALSHLGRFDPARGAFGAWLFGIARNLLNQHRRARRRSRARLEAAAPHSGLVASAEEQALHSERRAELRAALENLNERSRDLIGLKFGAQLTNRRIAELTGLSESNVGVIVYRAVRQLRRELDPADRVIPADKDHPAEEDHPADKD